MTGHGSQRGYGLIEMIISLGVTSLVLLGLGSVMTVAFRAFFDWSAPVVAAGTATTLFSSIQADSHRYVPCGLGDLELCVPHGGGLAVNYARSANACSAADPCNILRTEVSGATQVVARGLVMRPNFTYQRALGLGACDGYVAVQSLQYAPDLAPRPEMRLYFHAPEWSTASGASCP